MGAGHGLAHSKTVAADAGAIIQVESRFYDINSRLLSDLIIYAEIAGLLHDIRRKEKDHTIRGSEEAKRVLEDFKIESEYKRYIADAIRNHEAFKVVPEPENEIAKLISDSLYDADKFRWGPDNFTPLECPAIYGGDDINKVLIPYRKGGVKAPSFLTGFTYYYLVNPEI